MSASDFVKFYSEYLPQHPALKKEVDDSPDRAGFFAAVLKHGKAAGFTFAEAEVDEVMRASLRHAAELDEADLEAVVGGAGASVPKTVQISTIKSLTSAPGANFASTTMCPTWNMPAGNLEKL